MKGKLRSASRLSSQLLLILVWTTTGALSETLDKGPYLQNVTTDGATICWVTVTETGEGKQYAYHQAPISGLKPATEYTYYAGERGELKGSFRTAPIGRQPFRFVAYGDSRTNHAVHRSVLNAISRANPRFVINSGDIVSDGNRADHWDEFFKIAGEFMARVPYWPVLGNHEDNAALYYNIFALPGIERYYSFDYGTCHFVMLDSDGLALVKQENQQVPPEVMREYRQARKDYWQKQIEWLEKDLEAHKDADFIFATFHHPLYSSPKSEGRRREQRITRERFEELLHRYKVTAVFNGHDHVYERNVVDGLHCIVTGGGGASLYDFGDPLPTSVKRESVHHFVIIDVDDDTATFTALTPDERVIDTFQVSARN
jgi:hypothetical protein